jgi:hypothetical protein
MTGLIGSQSWLDIIPVLHRLIIFKSKDFEAYIPFGEIVLCMCKNKIAIFKNPNDIDTGRRFGQTFK